MKKYRSLLCMSTTNHNILYFLFISRTSFANNGNRLWKAQNPQARRALGRPILPQILCSRGSVPVSGIFQKPSPRRRRAQGAESVHFDPAAVQPVEIREELPSVLSQMFVS
jgi:hypothetical protein